MNKNTLNFVKAVVNPILAEEAALVPDLEAADSLCLTDYIEISRPVNGTASAVRGILIWLRVHESDLYTSSVQTSGFVRYIYSLNYAFTDANGVMLPDSVTGKFYEVVPMNIVKIQGDVEPSVSLALVTGLRLFAMGLRVLPTVEYVTDSTVNYLVRIIGGQLSMNELYAAKIGSLNVETIIRNSSCAETFANNEGCCSRYNPFQNEQQLRMQSLEDCLNSAQSFGFHKMPAIFCQFSNSTAIAATAPLILHARFWIHGILRKPSPIYAQQSLADTGYPYLRSKLSGCHPSFPIVTKGHSFPAIGTVAGIAMRILNALAQTYLTDRPRGKINLAPRRRRRRVLPKNTRGGGGGGRGRKNLNNGNNRNNIGSRRQPMMPKNPRNVPIYRRAR